MVRKKIGNEGKKEGTYRSIIFGHGVLYISVSECVWGGQDGTDVVVAKEGREEGGGMT